MTFPLPTMTTFIVLVALAGPARVARPLPLSTLRSQGLAGAGKITLNVQSGVWFLLYYLHVSYHYFRAPYSLLILPTFPSSSGGRANCQCYSGLPCFTWIFEPVSRLPCGGGRRFGGRCALLRNWKMGSEENTKEMGALYWPWAGTFRKHACALSGTHR